MPTAVTLPISEHNGCICVCTYCSRSTL